MSKKLISIVGALLVTAVSAQNMKLDETETNCRKVDGYGPNDKMAIASKYKVPLSSVQFIGAQWQLGQYGSMRCIFIFDTANGPKKCRILQLLTDDNGKTAFATVAPFGNANLCNE